MDNNNQNEGKFLSGFLLGILVGGFVVFLLGTKKGKKLLKAISEDGMDNISSLLEKAEKTEEFPDENLDKIVKKPSFAKVPHFAEASRGKSEGRGEFAFKEKSFEERPKPRRFFRGISRRVN